MVSFNAQDMLLLMTVILFLMGMAITITGILILIFRAASGDIHTLAVQSTQLAQKGLAEEVAGLVGNASALLLAVDQMVRTSAGIGLFLTVAGLLVMGSACLLALKLF
jgi:hypothetical protein